MWRPYPYPHPNPTPDQARYPYLDEDVVATLAALPLPLLCDLRHEAGRGDKVVLDEW